MPKANDLSFEVLRRASASFSPVAVASYDGTLFVNGKFTFFRTDDKGSLKEASKTLLSGSTRGLIVNADGIWAYGSELRRSTDLGATFSTPPLPDDERGHGLAGMALDSAGALWGGGDLVLCKEAKAKGFKIIKGPSDEVTAVASSRLGVLMGTHTGQIWIAAKGALKATSLKAKEPIRAICQTAAGTILAIAGEEYNAKPKVFRSTNGGKSWDSSSLPKSLLTLIELPDGPVIAAGWEDAIAASADEGRTFKLVPHKTGTRQNFTSSCVHDGAVILGGELENLVKITNGTSPTTTKVLTKKTAPKKRTSNGYVGSGTFKKDLEAVFGALKPRPKPRKRHASLETELARVPDETSAELSALFDLYATYKVPALCRLREGGFCSMPAQYGLDEEGLREEEWFTDKKTINSVLNALEIFNDQGSPFVLVGAKGVALFYEDPHGYAELGISLETFLKVLLKIEAAVKGKATAAEAQKLLTTSIKKRRDPEDFFGRTLANAK